MTSVSPVEEPWGTLAGRAALQLSSWPSSRRGQWKDSCVLWELIYCQRTMSVPCRHQPQPTDSCWELCISGDSSHRTISGSFGIVLLGIVNKVDNCISIWSNNINKQCMIALSSFATLCHLLVAFSHYFVMLLFKYDMYPTKSTNKRFGFDFKKI